MGTTNLVSLEVVKQNCANESERYRWLQASDPAYCLELLRRALVLADQQAWQYVYQQYGEQVARWVRAHPAFRQCGEEADYFVNGAFSRFAQAVTPEKFHRFKGLGEVLQYLKLCVGSTILDYLRAQEPKESVALPLWLAQTPKGLLENHVEKRQYTQYLWQKIESHLKSREEKVLMECVFVFDMKPGQLAEQYPDLFPDTRRVYRVLENVLKRLRRDPELSRLWLDQKD
jgi:hypothetical protein